MIDLFRKTFFMGLGAASLTADHLKALVDDLQKSGKLSRDEAEKLAREMAIKTSEHVKNLAVELEAEGKLSKEEIEKFAMEMAAKTSESIKKMADELKEKGKLTKEDAEAFAKEASARADVVKTEIETRFNDLTTEIVKRLRLATREELDALTARVEALENAAKGPTGVPPDLGS